jgi:hypothetical protein
MASSVRLELCAQRLQWRWTDDFESQTDPKKRALGK